MTLPSILLHPCMPAHCCGLCKMLCDLLPCPACTVPCLQLTTQCDKTFWLVHHMLASGLSHALKELWHEMSLQTPFPCSLRTAASASKPACSPAGATAGPHPLSSQLASLGFEFCLMVCRGGYGAAPARGGYGDYDRYGGGRGDFDRFGDRGGFGAQFGWALMQHASAWQAACSYGAPGLKSLWFCGCDSACMG